MTRFDGAAFRRYFDELWAHLSPLVPDSAPEEDAALAEVRKLSLIIPVSREVLDDAEWREPTAEERAEFEAQAAELAAARKARLRVLLDRHYELIEEIGGLAGQVAGLHAPCLRSYATDVPYCEGCDAGSGAEEDPPWPCRTWDLIDAETR